MNGKQLNKKWKVGAQHSLYDKNGKWYHVLNKFPGALFDPDGYILFDTEVQFMSCKYLKINVETNTVHVEGTIKDIPGYTFGEDL